MGGTVLKRIATYIVVAGGWLLAGIRTALDLVGWSTAPDDVTVAESRLDQFFVWLLSLPWWVPWGFALISTLRLIWVPWPELFEALRTQHELQATIIRAASDNHKITEMAIDGIFGGLGNRNLQHAASRIYSAAGSSPIDVIQFDELQKIVKTVEREYQNYCAQSHQLVRSLKEDTPTTNLSQINTLWLEWVVSHNIMTDTYDKIKEDDRYKYLYRPFKRSQFGPMIIQTIVKDGAFPILLPSSAAT